jgi:transcriptional regulator with XRE-family HTH domain
VTQAFRDSPVPDTASLGADIRALRKARGLTLAALALALGRSVGFLSQVERGLSAPSIADLRALARTFQVPLGFFFGKAEADPAERGFVVRAATRRRLGDPAGGLSEELLSPDLGGAFEIIRSVFEAGSEMGEVQQRDTEEAGYLVAGSLELWIGERRFRLAAGDSFRFKNQPYRWRNPGKDACVVIWVIAPPVY